MNIQTIIDSGVKMRVCDGCKQAVFDTLTSTKDGTQYDLCKICKEKVTAYIGTLKPSLMPPNPVERAYETKRKPGRPAKETKGE